MQLFLDSIDRELDELHRNGVRLRFIGDRHALSVRLQSRMAASEQLTAANQGLKLQVAVSYGGRWDILQAARKLAAEAASGALRPEDIDEARFARELALGDVSDPWRSSHQQLPAVEPRIHGDPRVRGAVAGFRRVTFRSGTGRVRDP